MNFNVKSKDSKRKSGGPILLMTWYSLSLKLLIFSYILQQYVHISRMPCISNSILFILEHPFPVRAPEDVATAHKLSIVSVWQLYPVLQSVYHAPPLSISQIDSANNQRERCIMTDPFRFLVSVTVNLGRRRNNGPATPQ